jgi:hypothetical protein
LGCGIISITIDDVEYQFEDMTQEQQMLVNHVADLDRKLDICTL